MDEQTDTSPEERLSSFIAEYSPEIGALAFDVLERMRARLPGAVELVYDNYNALVIGFGPTERASDAVFSLALYPRWINLFFLHGAGLPDPQHLLKGTGKQVRNVVLETAGVLDEPAVRELMSAALERSEPSIDGTQARRTVIKSVSAKKRPRRR